MVVNCCICYYILHIRYVHTRTVNVCSIFIFILTVFIIFLFKLFYSSNIFLLLSLFFETYSCAAVYFPLYCCVTCKFLPKGINKGTSYLILSYLILGPIAGHVGDGNFHCLMVVDPSDPEEQHQVHLFTERLAR